VAVVSFFCLKWSRSHMKTEKGFPLFAHDAITSSSWWSKWWRFASFVSASVVARS